jgi:pimeloyl-[acyl-carrier protein] methyl ester esterase
MNRQLNLEVVGQGIPMVLLHGWGWSASIWKPLVSDLKDDFQLYLVDLPGLGHSPFFSDQDSFKDMANLLFQVVPEEAVWLGWSLGGMLAFWVASHHPEKVSRLVTVAASPKFIADGSWPGVSLKTLAKFSETLLKEYTKTLEDFLELQLRGSLHAEELFASLKKD